jgi:hypothetical protein
MKTYILLPLAALAVFAYFYHNFDSQYEARQAAAKQAAIAERDAKLAAEAAARESAIQETLLLQKQRKAEREARDARDAQRKQQRQSALDARDAAFRETEKLTRQTDHLQKQVAAEQAALDDLVKQQKQAGAEQLFIKQYTQQAAANVRALQNLLDQLAAAEKQTTATTQKSQSNK